MMQILHSGISKSDSTTSQSSINLLRSYLTRTDRSLVFFVGAGASMAGNTGMPSTPTLLYQLLVDSLTYSGAVASEMENLKNTLKDISYKLGFEITLNDFWQICPQATSMLYTAFAKLEQQCRPNRVHTFLATWLASGGTVITTNYDRLIEREWTKLAPLPKSRFRIRGAHSFRDWREDVKAGGCLFKIHGSLDDPGSCLGALEHVGTQLTGNRGKLLTQIMHKRPICFVGWRGVDPDIPPLLQSALAHLNPALPIFWIHYEGSPAGSITLDQTLTGMTTFTKPLASQNPVVTDADRAFGVMLRWLGTNRRSNVRRSTFSFDFQQSVGYCTKTGATRMVGIALRRGGNFAMAERILNVALSLATTSEERSNVLAELSLLHQQIGGRNTYNSRKYLARARTALGDQSDLWQKLNLDFGLLSQSIVALKNQPWLLLRVRPLFRQYKQDIARLRQTTNDPETVALHESQYSLYVGRLLFKLFGWLAKIITPLKPWIMRPFDIARGRINDAKEIHVHSHIDVLAYRAVALAHLHLCVNARADLPEIDRLVAILNDDARTRHWADQKQQIIEHCPGN